jgi:hypothetical protein
MLNMITAGALQQHRRCVRARCGSSGWVCITCLSNFPNRYYALRGYNNKSLADFTTTQPPHLSPTTPHRNLPSNSGITVAHSYRTHRHQHSSRIVHQNGWRQRYALTAGRAIGPWKANCDAGKTGGKTGGKGDSHVKTTKSHSAKAGLQVSHCRVPSSPRPAHLGFDSCQSYDALTLPLHHSSLAVA